MNVYIYIRLETNVLVFSGGSSVWVKTEGFSAQNTSPNLGEESKMSCEGGWGQGSLHVRDRLLRWRTWGVESKEGEKSEIVMI